MFPSLSVECGTWSHQVYESSDAKWYLEAGFMQLNPTLSPSDGAREKNSSVADQPISECAQQVEFPVRDYDLAATLNSGQAFRWTPSGASWEGVIGRRWVRLSVGQTSLAAEVGVPVHTWEWLADYLQLDAD